MKGYTYRIHEKFLVPSCICFGCFLCRIISVSEVHAEVESAYKLLSYFNI